jgi:hypothetical protein
MRRWKVEEHWTTLRYMRNHDHMRVLITLDGPLVNEHRLPLSEFTRVTRQFHRALQDVAIVLSGYGPSGHGGRSKKFIEEATDLNVIAPPRAGSFVLELEVPSPRTIAQEGLPVELDAHLGERAVESLVSGLAALAENAVALPTGFDPGVLKAIVPFRTSIKRGLTDIAFTSRGERHEAEAHLDAERVDLVARLIKRPIRAHAVAEGTLQMVDFKALQCRIDRPPRPGVLCFFVERDRDAVQQAVRQFVRVEGEGEFEAGHTEPSKVDVASIAVLYEALPFDPQAFWQTTQTAELAGSAAPGFKLARDVADDPWRDDEEAAQLIAAITRSA